MLAVVDRPMQDQTLNPRDHSPTRCLRVAVLVRRFEAKAGGAENYALNLAAHLAKQAEVHVLAQHVGELPPGVQAHLIPCWSEHPRWLNQLWFALASWWRTRHGFDVVHSHDLTWHGAVQSVHVLPVRETLWARRSGWRRWAVALKVATSPRLWTYLALEATRYAPQPGRAIVLSAQALREPFLRAYPASVAMIRVVPPGVELPPLIDTATRLAARVALGLHNDAFVLAFVANDVRRKGLATLLTALGRLPESVQLIVVGEGRGRAEFEAQAAALGARVRFVGARDDIWPIYRAVDALVHPTREDTYAMVVLEALAAALPVVVSAAPWCGLAAELKDGEQALLLPDPTDAQVLAERIAVLQADAGLRQRLGNAGRLFATTCGWDARARELAEIYAAAASSNPER